MTKQKRSRRASNFVWQPMDIDEIIIGTKAGCFVTIDGQPVFVSGPSQGGGKASPSGGVPSDVATKEN